MYIYKYVYIYLRIGDSSGEAYFSPSVTSRKGAPVSSRIDDMDENSMSESSDDSFMSAHDTSPSIRDEEEASHKAEDLKDLITEKDLLRTQLMSNIRIIESDISKNKLFAELQVYININVYSYKYIYIYIHVYTYVYLKYIYIYVYVYIYLFIFICIYIYIYIYLYIYIYIYMYMYI
jgi:hypothetical protein